MRAAVLKDIVDGVAQDLEDNAGLAEHNLVKYRRPRLIVPDMCPLLLVWPIDKTQEPVTTHWVAGLVRLQIAWYLPTVEELEDLTNDDDVSTAFLEAIGRIEDRCAHMMRDGLAVNESWEVQEEAVQYLPAEMEEGLTEGYGVTMLVRTGET